MPIISVVIPVYNGEKTIKETIDSVLNQSFSYLELIIINDGSTDKTLEIVSGIKDERVKVYSYRNTGLAASRNRGISLAKGEYISFIDADDLWTPDKLESQLQALQENPEAAVAYSWTNCIDETGKFLGKGSYLSFSGDVSAKLLLTNFIDNGSNVLIRIDALKKVGNFDESRKSCEDWDMWLRLASDYSFVAVSKPQVLYRMSATSMSVNFLRMEAESMEVIERACDRNPIDFAPLKQLSKGNIYKYLLFRSLKSTSKQRNDLISIKFLSQALRYDPSLLKTKVIWKAFLKIITTFLLPIEMSKTMVTRFKTLYNVDALLIYMRKGVPWENK
ncbi:glycosyltransferase [Phormidium sp. LEGE 05292]|uniref:glycosyltransferase n=1 Tax=[Phormidium] sp. LEGE 05292 TaxID=767427 RepID=UPI0018811E98|nr:glycosyltransferase [Phormidium sp. LEGE 05292]MBE9228369.1 glycosyltransferase [Phormidium sp. LEGE 05292]